MAVFSKRPAWRTANWLCCISSDWAQRMGLAVRVATGVFVGIPYLVSAFARWGVVDPRRWPANRSPQGTL
jgi:hypothetical protein